MNKNYPHFVITFPSVHHALKFEAVFKKVNTPVSLIPVPREISSSCGVAAKLVYIDLDMGLSVMQENGLEYDAIYKYKEPNKKPELIQNYQEEE
ncbi:MAG: DUF3343 domain-containing protein [Tepidanaerobacteraceae bacterium]|jgi:hypothetical protein|nr:DUF3343 domain-containing protein [Thermoanaerobacterales bacterium]